MTEAAIAPTGEEGGTGEANETDQESNSSTDQSSTETQESNVSDWRAEITDPDLAKFIKNYNTPNDLAKSALQFRQKLSNAVSLPGKTATDEEKAEFFKKLGVPENPDGYEYSIPDLPETITAEEVQPAITQIKESLHKAGATPETASAALDTVLDILVKSHEEANQEWTKSVEDSDKALRQEWLGDYDTNMEYSKRAQSQFLSSELLGLMKDTKVGGVPLSNHPDMAKMFADIGRKMGEGGLQYIASEEDTQSFNDKQNELTSQGMDAMDKGDRILAEKLFAQRDKLAKQFHGEN